MAIGQILPGGAIFSPPKPKSPPPPPPAPKRTDPDVVRAREEVRKAELRRRGRASTILTGSLDDEPLLGRPTATGGNSNSSLG